MNGYNNFRFPKVKGNATIMEYSLPRHMIRIDILKLPYNVNSGSCTTDCSDAVLLMLFIVCVTVYLLATGLFYMFCPVGCLSNCCFSWIMSGICDHRIREEGCDYLTFLWFVACELPIMDCLLYAFAVIGGLCCVFVVHPGHLVYYSLENRNRKQNTQT